MAYHRLKLPGLKLTRRPTTGGKVYEIIQRGDVGQDHDHSLQDSAGGPVVTPAHSSSDLLTTGTSSDFSAQWDLIEPTGHELEKQSMVAGWNSIRDEILSAAIEESAMPSNVMCFVCCEAMASLRCRKCGPSGHYCPGCFELCHQRVNIFHVAEKWEVNTWV